MKTVSELKADFLIYSLQSQKIKRKIAELTKIQEVIDEKAKLTFEVIEDRMKQEGENVDLPDLPIDLEP